MRSIDIVGTKGHATRASLHLDLDLKVYVYVPPLLFQLKLAEKENYGRRAQPPGPCLFGRPNEWQRQYPNLCPIANLVLTQMTPVIKQTFPTAGLSTPIGHQNEWQLHSQNLCPIVNRRLTAMTTRAQWHSCRLLDR